MTKTRSFNRSNLEFRPVKITRNCNIWAEGSVLIEFGRTKVLCTASVSNKLPPFIKDQKLNHGWLTAEYNMLPRATNTRNSREGRKGSISGRTMEIQRLIGRALRNAVDLEKMPDVSITIDCDVLQADGGTRTTSINGACIALYDACQYLVQKGLVAENPFKEFVAAISIGINEDEILVDLDYEEDSNIGADCNVVMSESEQVIEFQLSAEKQSFNKESLDQVYNSGLASVKEIIRLQKESLGIA
ncbi:ribonuclease PH [Psittacicella melopsittaci]|uniref:Ribonuclease PH n=1 Tax=Psittacicella melopsittaci TaxID=2028576 RepID=A0A3A1Y5V3_9GAMM|nr:ribonuclease PH [Psittacicella melopsittaci]RIY32588.1 ribonuclease PH [Psittacicella melopsittaci]